MADVLDKCTIIEFGTGVLVSNTTDSVGVRLDTAAGIAELVIIPRIQLESGLIPLQGQQS
jgi:hypothetical protein